MHTSVRFRLTAWYVGALALTLVVLALGLYSFTRSRLYRWVDEGLEERVESLSGEVRLTGADARPDLPANRHGAYSGPDDGFAIFDARGRLALSRGLDTQHLAGSRVASAGGEGVLYYETQRGLHRHDWRLVSEEVEGRSGVAAVAVVGHDMAELDELLERLAWSMWILVPVALTGAALGGYALAGRALAPVADITAQAARISERDLSQRLPIRSKDELGRLATTFNAMIARLQDAFERQRRFTADASHELRTPLSIIQAVSSQKLIQRREPEDYEQALRRIDEAAGYMTRLVAHLLTMARADSGDVSLAMESVELVDLLGHVAGQVGDAYGRVIPVRAGGPVYLTGDPVRLTQLFLNLLENAAKYTPQSGSVEVEVEVETDPTSVRVSVSDTGVGIPPEHLPHIFERFYRVDKARSREQGGTGLGLSIARWIAEIHEGRIRAESEPERGTRMTVTLPLSPGGGAP